MSARILDRDRFAKCRALMDRGSTSGERAAGKAAATRVAAAAGLSLAEAIAMVDLRQPRATPRVARQTDHARHPRRPYAYAWAQPKTKPAPITVEELLRQKEVDLERKKKAAAREEKRLRKQYAEQEQTEAAAREAQAVRDREWAEQRKEAGHD